MPRRAVDDLTVSKLNRIVGEIEDHKRKPGLIRVGGVSGLGLNVRRREYASGPAFSASWLLRRTFEGKRRDFALGAWPDVTLAQARERARVVADKLWSGVDPLDEKKQSKEMSKQAPSFREAAVSFFDRQIRGKINTRDEPKWLSDLEAYAFEVIGELGVDKIQTNHIMEIVDQPHIKYGTSIQKRLWDSVPDRASRMLKKIEHILAAETRLGNRAGENPAMWRGHLSHLLPKPSSIVKPGKQAALPYILLPDFMASLRERTSSPSRLALEFLILTASRSGEVRKATWDEVDMERGLWIIPESRMKARREHRVPLSNAVLEVLRSSRQFASTRLIWPGQGIGSPMSDATLAALVKKLHAAELKSGRPGWLDPRSNRPAVPHGFRSTFRDWAAETTQYPSEMAEIALAHEVGSQVERAYRRTDMLEKRREMMEEWALFVLHKKTS